jgi:hypothetical protein
VRVPQAKIKSVSMEAKRKLPEENCADGYAALTWAVVVAFQLSW